MLDESGTPLGPESAEMRVLDLLSEATTSDAVSYTHLTLPTSDLVQISVVAVSLKKKREDIGVVSSIPQPHGRRIVLPSVSPADDQQGTQAHGGI